MINRILIRIRVIQIVYAWYQNRNKDLGQLEKELLLGLQKSYDLYFYFLLLMIELTDLYEKRVETKMNKFLPTQEDLNPNMQLVNNQFISQLRNNQMLVKYLTERPMSWGSNITFLRNMLNSILKSDAYKEYIQIEKPTYKDDKDFWKKTFKTFIRRNEELDDILEDESIFWNDDIEIVQSFVHKTINRFNKSEGENQALLPMFNDDEDKEFAIKLLHETILNEQKFREQITHHAENWDFERIAFMDVIIMQVAMAELHSFPSIPISVTLNEYIDIAKSYSTPKSSTFINGILDAVVVELKKDKTFFKN